MRMGRVAIGSLQSLITTLGRHMPVATLILRRAFCTCTLMHTNSIPPITQTQYRKIAARAPRRHAQLALNIAYKSRVAHIRANNMARAVSGRHTASARSTQQHACACKQSCAQIALRLAPARNNPEHLRNGQCTGRLPHHGCSQATSAVGRAPIALVQRVELRVDAQCTWQAQRFANLLCSADRPNDP